MYVLKHHHSARIHVVIYHLEQLKSTINVPQQLPFCLLFMIRMKFIFLLQDSDSENGIKTVSRHLRRQFFVTFFPSQMSYIIANFIANKNKIRNILENWCCARVICLFLVIKNSL